MSLGESKSIYYFNSEGRRNLNKTVELVHERAIELGIKNIVVFTANGEGALLLKKRFTSDDAVAIHAATFPYKQVFFSKDSEGNPTEKYAETSNSEVRARIIQEGINLVQGIMPLQDIILPGTKDVKTLAINNTLSLLCGGLRLCVQAILMAVDGGYVEPGERVIAMSADTAIVAKSCLSTWLFHPTEGMEISEIICKPHTFTITRSSSKE